MTFAAAAAATNGWIFTHAALLSAEYESVWQNLIKDELKVEYKLCQVCRW